MITSRPKPTPRLGRHAPAPPREHRRALVALDLEVRGRDRPSGPGGTRRGGPGGPGSWRRTARSRAWASGRCRLRARRRSRSRARRAVSASAGRRSSVRARDRSARRLARGWAGKAARRATVNAVLILALVALGADQRGCRDVLALRERLSPRRSSHRAPRRRGAASRVCEPVLRAAHADRGDFARRDAEEADLRVGRGVRGAVQRRDRDLRSRRGGARGCAQEDGDRDRQGRDLAAPPPCAFLHRPPSARAPPPAGPAVEPTRRH